MVSGSLNEFKSQVGGYSADQLQRDFYDILKVYKLEVDPDGALAFLHEIVEPAFEAGNINCEDDLKKLVIGNQPMPITEAHEI